MKISPLFRKSLNISAVNFSDTKVVDLGFIHSQCGNRNQVGFGENKKSMEKEDTRVYIDVSISSLYLLHRIFSRLNNN